MKALLFAVFLGTSAAAWGQDVVATIKQEAQKCAKALLAGDYDSIVAYTSPRIVKAMGGKEAMIGALKQGLSQMKAEGAGFLEATVGQPANPKRVGAWQTSMIPQHLVMKVSGGKLYKDSSLLGISQDDGKHWVFVDLGGNITKDQFGKMFPELDGKIAIPEKKPPVFKKDEGA